MRRIYSPPREVGVPKIGRNARRVLLPLGEGGPKGRMRADFALTRRFAAPSPGGRGNAQLNIFTMSKIFVFSVIVLLFNATTFSAPPDDLRLLDAVKNRDRALVRSLI